MKVKMTSIEVFLNIQCLNQNIILTNDKWEKAPIKSGKHKSIIFKYCII